MKAIALDKTEFEKNYINQIICGDSLTIMKQMPNECINKH